MIENLSAASWSRVKHVLEVAYPLDAPKREQFLEELQASDKRIAIVARRLLATEAVGEGLATLPLLTPFVGSGASIRIEPGQRLADRFDIENLLGRGGSGEVYRAFDRNRQIHVALKIVNSSLLGDNSSVAALRNELNTASLVSHPNVCRLIDLTIPSPEAPGPAFITMELLAGETLTDLLERGPLEAGEALLIVTGIVNGLEAAHARHIVHRDLKPGNIMLVPQEEGVRPVILDFGLARTLGSGESIHSGLSGEWCAGTPAYMAPEILEGKTATVASDIHSLGVILFQMATGRLPFEGDSPMAIALKRIAGPAPLARICLPSVDRRWEYVIAKCLQRDPAARPRSAREVLRLLTTPPPFAWAYRKFLPAIAAAVLFAVALIALRPPHVNQEAQIALDNARVAMENRTESGFRTAITDLRRATRQAPEWAVPWAELAYAYAAAGNWRFLDGVDASREAKNAALRAISLDSRLARAHAVLGWTRSLDFDEWVKAEPSFRRALSLDPSDGLTHYWFAVHLRKQGRFREAEAQLQTAMLLTHRQNPSIWTELGFLYWTEGRIDKMNRHMKEQLVAFPFFGFTRFLNARLLKMQGRFEEAQAELNFSKTLGLNPVTVLAERASLDASCGRRADADAELAQLEALQRSEQIDGLMVAGVYTSLGKFDSAFKALEDAYRKRDSTLLSLATSPVLRPLHSDPRFRALLARLHFTPQIMQQMGFKSSSASAASRQPSSTGTL